MWEDGYCRGRVADCLEEMDSEDPVRKSFSKMSIQLYNYGEGWVLGRCCYYIFILCATPFSSRCPSPAPPAPPPRKTKKKNRIKFYH